MLELRSLTKRYPFVKPTTPACQGATSTRAHA